MEPITTQFDISVLLFNTKGPLEHVGIQLTGSYVVISAVRANPV